jgi:hypothetical protein
MFSALKQNHISTLTGLHMSMNGLLDRQNGPGLIFWPSQGVAQQCALATRLYRQRKEGMSGSYGDSK